MTFSTILIVCLEFTDILSNKISEFFFDDTVLQCMFLGGGEDGGFRFMRFRFTQSFLIT
jgi:hypothetical protein